MKSPIIGYIVCTNMDPMHAAADYVGQPSTLWLGGRYATLFPSRRAARAAVKRTLEYAQQHKFKWPWVEESSIMAVRKLL